MNAFSISLGSSILWTGLYFSFMIFYTLLDIAVWRKRFPRFCAALNLFTIAFSMGCFLFLLKKAGYPLKIASHFTLPLCFLSLFCSVLLFLLLDRGLDRVFETLFPKSEQAYQETVQRLTASPAANIIQLCLFAPFIEEILMRGFLLAGLQIRYGSICALLVSSVLFAILHFNMVQSLSAFLCGIVLGLLYLKTGSVLCCIIAHSGYNILSLFMIMRSAGSHPDGS